MTMHINRTCDHYGKHDAWTTPCNGFWQEHFDFDADPLVHVGRHRCPQNPLPTPHPIPHSV